MTMAILSTTEFVVLHAEQDLRRVGKKPTVKRLTRTLPDLHGDTVRRTRHRLATWGIVDRDGVRTRAPSSGRPEPYAAPELSSDDLAEIEAERSRVFEFSVIPRMVLSGEITRRGRLPKENRDLIDRIVDAGSVSDIIRIFDEGANVGEEIQVDPGIGSRAERDGHGEQRARRDDGDELQGEAGR